MIHEMNRLFPWREKNIFPINYYLLFSDRTSCYSFHRSPANAVPYGDIRLSPSRQGRALPYSLTVSVPWRWYLSPGSICRPYRICRADTCIRLPPGAEARYQNPKLSQSYLSLFDVAKGPYKGDPDMKNQETFMSITIDGNVLTATAYQISKTKNDGQPYMIDQFKIKKV